MNWDAIGTIADVVGALAVVVSIVYLAIQIRQNTKQVEEQAKGQRFAVLGVLGGQWHGFRSNITSDPRVASIWRRGNEDVSQLDVDDRVLFDFLMAEFFWSFAYNWIMGVEEGLGTYIREDVSKNLQIFDSPGLREWWRTSPQRKQYPADFVHCIDQLFARQSEPKSSGSAA